MRRGTQENPYQYRNKRNDRTLSKNRDRRKQKQKSSKSRKQELLVFLGSASVVLLWFMSPISEWLVEFILLSIPLDSDLQLGYEALASLPYRTVRDRWGVEEIGNDLVDTFCSKQNPKSDFKNYYNVRQELCPYNSNTKWSFGVIHADFVNAFALPGGIIRVTDTLLKELQLSKGEIAALLGHEMGHVIHRHSQARLIEQKLLSLLIRALFYDDDDDHRETYGEALSELLLDSAKFLGQQKFSRRNEYQADNASWDILFASHIYDPRSLQSLLSKLWNIEGGTGVATWESTHPGTKERIGVMQDKWNGLSYTEQRQLKDYPFK